MRVKFQRPDGKLMEMDVLAESDCGRVVAVEVKKTKAPAGASDVQDFIEKVDVYAALNSGNKILPAFFCAGGFAEDGRAFCGERGVGMAERLELF
jgi:hypothetical protein